MVTVAAVLRTADDSESSCRSHGGRATGSQVKLTVWATARMTTLGLRRAARLSEPTAAVSA